MDYIHPSVKSVSPVQWSWSRQLKDLLELQILEPPPLGRQCLTMAPNCTVRFQELRPRESDEETGWLLELDGSGHAEVGRTRILKVQPGVLRLLHPFSVLTG